MKGSEVIEKMKTGWKLVGIRQWGGKYLYRLQKQNERDIHVGKNTMKALENARFIEITKSSKEFMSDIEFGLSKTFFEGWSDVIEKLKFTGDH